MKTKTELLIETWNEARTRFSNQLLHLNEVDLKKKLLPSPNSIGFLIRHIGDVELLFAKNVFGAYQTKVIAKTVIAQKDTEEWTNLQELTAYVTQSYEILKSVVDQQEDSDWERSIETKEFGAKTKSEAFGRIISHTTYHAGQLAIINKYGDSQS